MNISRRSFLLGMVGTALSAALARAGRGPGSVLAAALKEGGRGMKEKGRLASLPTVVSVHSPGATSWDYSTYPYVDFVDGQRVRKMLGSAVMALTGEKTEAGAWKALFPGYRPGEMIAVKPNLNDIHKGFRGFVTSPAVINAVVDGLVVHLGARPSDIAVYDLCRAIPDELRSRIKEPVNFVESKGDTFLKRLRYKALGAPLLAEADPGAEIKMSSKVTDLEGRPVRCYLPRVITSSRHIINIPIMKSHQFVALSGALKNHYGTVRFSDGSLSPRYLHPPIIEDSIVDINSHEEIRSKTRLVVMDALFARTRQHGGSPEKWTTLGGGSPERLFVSRDPVAVDALSRHYLKKEMDARGAVILSDLYLRRAGEAGIGLYEDTGKRGKFREIRVGELEV